MSHLPARRAYQDSSPDQLWQLNGRSMLMDVQGGEFLLDDSVIDVHPPPIASRIPKPSANAQPEPDGDHTPRPARPRPSMLPITSKAIERGPQTARRRRMNSTKDANKTPVQLSIPLPETTDDVVAGNAIVQGSRPASSRSRTQQPISPPNISSPVPGGEIVVPPALPDFTFTQKRKLSETNTAIPLRQPKSILKRPKSTILVQPLEPGWDEVQVETSRRQPARLSGSVLPELDHPPVPFSREPEVLYESEDAVPSVPVKPLTAMEWEAHPGSHYIDLRTDRGDVFVDQAPVQERSRRLSIIAPILHPEEPQPAIPEVLNAQEEGMIISESLSLPPRRSSTHVPPAQRVDADWEMEPLTEVPPEPENRSVIRSKRSSGAAPRLLSPIDLEALERPIPPHEVGVGEPEPSVKGLSVRPRRSSIRVLQPPELIAFEQDNQQAAPLPRRHSPPTASLQSVHTTVSDALTRPKPKLPTRPSVAPTRQERCESQAPVRGRDQQVKAAAPRPKRASEMLQAPLRSLAQVDTSRRRSQSPQKRTVPPAAREPISRPTSQRAVNPSTGAKVPMKPKVIPQVAAQQSTRIMRATAENTMNSAFPRQPSRALAAPSQTTLVSTLVPEAVVPRPRTSIMPTSATSNISATDFPAIPRPTTESERVPDDMFERRKRDNYVAKPVGLDLTDHSTRGRGLDAVGSTSVGISLNHVDPNVTLSTSMPGGWVENSSVIIKRHERSRSVSRPPSSPILAKMAEPQDMMESESEQDEDSEVTEVGEVLEPERMKELNQSRQPGLTIEELEQVPSLVSSVKRKPASTIQSRSRSTSKPPSRASSRPHLEIRAPPPRAAPARPPPTNRLQPRSRSGEPTEPTRSTSQARSASNPPHGRPVSTAARVSDEGLGTKLAQLGEMLLNAVSSGLSFTSIPSVNTSGETVRHPDLRLSELSPRKRASSVASQKAIRGDRGRPTSRETGRHPVTQKIKGKPVSQNVVPSAGILKKPRSNEAPRAAHALKRVTQHLVAPVPPKSGKSTSRIRQAATAPSRQPSKNPAPRTRPVQKTLEHPTSARPRPPSRQRSHSRSTSVSLDYAMDNEMEREPDVEISVVDAYEAKMFPSRVIEPSFANIVQSSPARRRRSNSRKRALDAEINDAEQDRIAKRMRIDNAYVSPKLHIYSPNREPSAPVKSRNQNRSQNAKSHEREVSPVPPRGRSRSNSRPRMEEVVSRGYLDQYRDEEIQEVLMEMDQGDVEEDVFGSVLENSSSRLDSIAGPRPQRKTKTSHRNPALLLPSSTANAPKLRRNTIAPKCRLTVPRSPKFSDTHKQRALRGIARERERKEREKQELKKREEEKRLRVECWQRPPTPPMPVREPKVTVPQAFTFQSDSRAEHWREFEEKRTIWEARSSALATSASSQGPHPIRKQVPQVYSSAAPKLFTEARAAQRREFDEAIREKEAELERLREERARQLEREEAEWRKQERRRLDQKVKANPIPDWYQNAPRRGNTKA